jgi:hypothetical protein
MATIAKSGVPSLATALPPQNEQIPGLLAGEAIAGGDLCTIAANGTVMKTAAAGATVHGVAAFQAQVGQAVTLYRNVRFGYGAGLTPGTIVRVSPTVAGAIDDAGAGTIVGFVVDATRIQFRGL